MGLLDKLKNVFFEEEEVEEELEDTRKLASKVEISKKNIEFNSNEDNEKIDEKLNEKVINNPKIVEKPTIEKSVINDMPKKDEMQNNKFSMMFEEEDFVFDNDSIVKEKSENEKVLYPEHKEESYTESLKKESNNKGYSKIYYESKETKTFTPSPIISPIYGILDKNYKKEEVITKKEIRLTSYGKADLDSVRNKAFGEINEKQEEKANESIKVEPDTKIYDVNNNKPTVKGVTLEDADEYYNDLGLAYNVDYKDKAKEEKEQVSEKVITRVNRKNEKRNDDNLFDLIESMYDKED